MAAAVNAGAGILPASRGQVPGVGWAPSSIIHPAGSFSHAVGLTQHPTIAVPPIPSTSLNIPQAPPSVPATLSQMHIQPQTPPTALSTMPPQPSQSIIVTDDPSHNGFLVHRQHYRPTSVLNPIPYPNNSPSTEPFTQHKITVSSCATPTQNCQYMQTHQQWDTIRYACPQLHRHPQDHQAPLMDIPIPIEGHVFSWTARRQGAGGINASLDEALEDFITGVDAEMKGGLVLMPPDPSLSGHWPGRYVEELGVGKGIVVEWMKMQ